MLKLFKLFCGDESGMTTIEYGLIAAFVSVAAIGAWTTMGNSQSDLIGTVSDAMTPADAGDGGGGRPAVTVTDTISIQN